MLRGVFMPGGVTQEQVDYYIDLLNKVRATPDWKTFMGTGAFNQTVMSGKKFDAWLGHEEARHFQLMKTAGFIAH
jgi:tripartite-type tricarboxylate transporter receptor subunit TctC